MMCEKKNVIRPFCMDACFFRIPISKDVDVFETRQARTQTVMRFSLFFSNHSRGKFNIRIHNQSSRSKSFYPLTNFMNDDKYYVYTYIYIQCIMMINKIDWHC